MNKYKKFRAIVQDEIHSNINLIIRGKNNEYHVFDRYHIVPFGSAYRVFSYATEIGIFHSTRAALSWCIANKYQKYSLADQLLDADNRLYALKNDIAVRVAIAERSNKSEFREELSYKIESKILRKAQLENTLAKCINLTKYQHRGLQQ